MTDAVRDQVRERAQDRCEYCHMPQRGHYLPFEVDHVIGRQHGGGNGIDNLALACIRCNRHKGPNVASVDERGNAVLLFNPRRQSWNEHFRYDAQSGEITGQTPEATATVRLLSMNSDDYVLLRLSLSQEGFSFA